MRHLEGHYCPKTIEITERFKFFKRSQQNSESAAEFMAQLRRLAKTCNFKQYLELAICDQFVCGLRDSKCQKELLCVAEFTADLTLQRVKAAKVVRKETEGMQESLKEKEKGNGGTHRIHSAKLECYWCGKPYHSAADCRYKDATCHMCQKTGHLARVCRSRKKKTELTADT
ncbi:uncharacterized protein [Dysidea avara]|uniref:uncharacterized protein n=1 Tax=Dysidea avara TaxID=196820 RepID=UPI00332B902E